MCITQTQAIGENVKQLILGDCIYLNEYWEIFDITPIKFGLQKGCYYVYVDKEKCKWVSLKRQRK